MKKYSSRLLFFVVLAVFLYGGSSITSSTANSAFTPIQDCMSGCATKRDVSLKRCDSLSGDSKTRCQNTANEQYNRCTQNCSSTGKP